MFPGKSALALSFLALVTVPVTFAQSGGVVGPIGGTAAAELSSPDSGIVLGEPLSLIEKLVAVTPLADGTQITKIAEERKWRDAQGRFRKESAPLIEGQEPDFQTVTIIDPIANTIAVLHPAIKTANLFHLPSKGQWALHPYVDQDNEDHEALPGVKVTVEKLPAKTIAGVYAVGRRVTRNRPPGTLGNDKPIVSVNDRYEAPDLKIMLENSLDDPRKQQMDLVTQLDRNPPDPALFSIPPDFKVHEVTVKEPQK